MSPPLLVFPHRFVAGCADFDSEGQGIDRNGEPLQAGWLFERGIEAFAIEYETDAHCVCYSIPNIGPHPRLNRGALSGLVARGLEPELRWALIDVDNPNHTPWSESELEGLHGELCARLRAAGGVVATSGWYATRSGYRLVWPLVRPVPVSRANGFLRALISEVRGLGIAADPRCKDWTRLFRMPRVVRDAHLQVFPMELGT